jgi:DedD protein
MGLLSYFKRRVESPGSPAVESGDAVQRARTRARQRLIGAVVLVIVGVIGFPLVFETQPRPIPVDIPIEMPRRENSAPLAMPPLRPRAATGVDGASAPLADNSARQPSAAPSDVITETSEDAGSEVAASAPAAAASKPGKSAVATVKASTASTETAAAKPPQPKPPVVVADASRAKALLDGKPEAKADTKPAAPAEAGRFVVQVGAFASADAAREVRLKVEKLGLKTYTQIASTAAGNRIRVRVGPFATRDEADKALAKARGAGMAGNVLTL